MRQSIGLKNFKDESCQGRLLNLELFAKRRNLSIIATVEENKDRQNHANFPSKVMRYVGDLIGYCNQYAS